MTARRYATALADDIRVVLACRILGHRWDNQTHHGTAARLCIRCSTIQWHRP